MRDILPYRAGSLAEEAWCRCSSCSHDVRLDIGRGFLRLRCGPVQTVEGRKLYLVSAESVCSKVCLVRRRRRTPVKWLDERILADFVGPGALEEFADVLETYRVTDRLHYWLPRFLEALALPKHKALRKTSSPGDSMNEIPDAFRRYPVKLGAVESARTRGALGSSGRRHVSAGK